MLAERGKRFGYTTDERNKFAIELAEMALEYNRKGFISIICAICHVKRVREEMRAIIKNIMEVYLDCPVDVCAKRDYKSNYVKALKGLCDNFVGVTEPYQISDHAELVLHTGKNTIEECSSILFKKAKGFISVVPKEAEII